MIIPLGLKRGRTKERLKSCFPNSVGGKRGYERKWRFQHYPLHKRILKGKERKRILVLEHTTHPMCPPHEATPREIERATNVRLKMGHAGFPKA